MRKRKTVQKQPQIYLGSNHSKLVPPTAPTGLKECCAPGAQCQKDKNKKKDKHASRCEKKRFARHRP